MRRLTQQELQDRPRMILNQANAFYQAGSRCEANIELAPRRATCPSNPVIVNYAFALELYLKLILVISEKSFSKIHLLNDLFAEIPAPAQDILCRKFLGGKQKLEYLLAEMADYFRFHRYEYEYEHEGYVRNYRNLREVAEALYNTIGELRPDLMRRQTEESFI